MAMEDENKPVSRKKFVLWGIGVLSVITAAKSIFVPAKRQKPRTVKMLTQDARLVEVEISKLPGKGKKIKNEEIHTWVKRKPSL